MMRVLGTWLVAAAAAMFSVSDASAQGGVGGPSEALVSQVEIPYESFTLDNGLRVITHTDRKAPIVAVSIWYHVGSKDEPEGKTGFAHLFEHLMFNGTEHDDRDYFEALQEIGATSYNGTTWFDRTNYFQNVPTPALERILFLESDRMGHLLGAVTQEKLDAQIGVVQNEKRQGDNQPFGTTWYRILEGLFPEGHPYRHSTIGSMEDLSNATLDDVKEWFRSWYGPNNAVLVLAGDIDAETARPLVEKYFGDIPPGPANPGRLEAWVPTREDTVREVMQDRVSNARVYRNWAVPGLQDEVSNDLTVAAAILANGPTSRLYQRLVRDEQLATGVSGNVQTLEAVGILQLTVDVQPGGDVAAVERIVDEEIARFRRDGPTPEEVARVAMRIVSGTVRGLESVGGFGGKAVTLAQGELYSENPEYYREQLEDFVALTPEEVRAAAAEWMDTGGYELVVTPYGQLAASTEAYDRSQPPAVGDLPSLDFPDVERAELSNGIEVTFARRTAVPVVEIAAVFDAGDAADPRDALGTQALLLSLLDEGTETRSANEIAEAEERLGASIGASSGSDTTRIGLSALTSNLDASLELYADIVRNPAFAQDELDRVRNIQLASIEREMTQPQGLALRLLPPLIYGETHPYGIPLTGTGTAEGVRSVTREDLFAFRDSWLRPDNAEIFVVGDTTLEEILPKLEAQFGDWRASGPVRGTKLFSDVEPPAESRIVLVDRPESPQSYIFAGYPLTVKGLDDDIALAVANVPLGGIFTSRLNMNLREEKGWSYGVRSSISGVREQAPFYVTAPVQSDRTGEALAELRSEIADFVGGDPITEEETVETIAFLTGRLPGAYESASSVLGALISNANLDRPDDYQETYAERLRALDAETVAARAQAEIDPDKLIYVVVGDAAVVRPQLEQLGLPIEER
ncbi:peptidase M16 [Pacificimonas flava]|uniref:Peptidase M16 n=2 Tax=Pacificimonas TaxID=1960290 RepID=A0A219B443_9SPHN|nr:MULTISPECIES: pitrilysin family protein [Pacificimonas]MBZ6377409.1 insulinase family protein [Pacificimonas aurantium]OWV32886.1 peptidase M16 [Pacificimonas flava]